MLHLTLSVVVLLISLFSDASGRSAGNFPLTDCHTGQFDILLMHTPNVYLPSLLGDITDIWIPDDNKNSRVLISKVNDMSANSDNACRIKMTKFDKEVVDVCSRMSVNASVRLDDNTNNNVQTEIQSKIQLAESILFDMGVGRRNSTYVAIIFVNLFSFPTSTTDEIMTIPDALQKANSTIKIFIFVLDFKAEIEPIHLRDTLYVGRYSLLFSHIASMALCKKCLPDWFLLNYKGSGDLLSCYKLHIASYKIDWFEASENCQNYLGSTLATVETKEELDFLQARLLLHLLRQRQVMYDPRRSPRYSTGVYIGLKRNSVNLARRFQWELKNPARYRPLVLNHWLPGKPAGGFNHACGIWLFSGVLKKKVDADQAFRNASAERLILFDNKSGHLEGWLDVGCGMKLFKASLCEVSLPRQLKNQGVIKKHPANKKSFNKASYRSEFIEFEGSIVSLSAFVQNEAFHKFLKSNNEDFPLFDCGEEAGHPRYIPYSYVCDYTDHCSNRRDEGTCYPYCQTCHSGQCISSEKLCDNYKDCGDGSDEENCQSCNGRRCCDGTCLPLHMFNDGEIDCSECKTIDNITVNDESITQEDSFHRNQTCAFICNIWQCMYQYQFNDGKLDCTGPEGHLDETLGKLTEAKSCSSVLGHTVWAPRCVYVMDVYGSVLGCRDLSHLQNCSNFRCQEGYYKCPGSYCIPSHYVLDGKSDCPTGEEERVIVSHTCAGNFACWNSKVCLHPDLICDGHTDCPHKDDELNCHVPCADGFQCVAGTVFAKNYNRSIHSGDLWFIGAQTRYIDLSGMDLSNVSYAIYNSDELFHVRLSRCRIPGVNESFPVALVSLSNVYKIDLSYNLITSLNGKTFDHTSFGSNLRVLNLSFNKDLQEFTNMRLFKRLETLDLSHTSISYLDGSFEGLENLKYLNLSHTTVSTFHMHIFPSSFILETLDLRGLSIVTFFENTFGGLTIRSSLYTDNFALCCPQVRGKGIPENTCHATEDAISSCFDLIGVGVQRVFLWLVAVTALFGNLIVIAYRLIWDRPVLKLAYGLFVTNLGISDFIMGLYLIIIAIADVYYQGMYVLYHTVWKGSGVCKVAGFLATFFIFLITVDRFLVLEFPYGQRKFTRVTKISAVTLAWCIGFVLSLIPVLPIFGNESIFSSSAMCIGFFFFFFDP